MNEIRPLAEAHHRLDEAVHELCDPITRTVLRDDLSATEHTGLSLLDQIASLGHGARSGKNGGQGSRMPLDPAKLDCWREIQDSASDLHDRAVMHSRLTPEQQIRRIVDLAQEWSDPKAVLWIVDHLRVWRSMIVSVLEPRRRLSIAAPCPACGARMALVQEPGTRERVQVDVLVVGMEEDGMTGATCIVCDAHWTPQQLEHLALVIGCEPIPEAS